MAAGISACFVRSPVWFVTYHPSRCPDPDAVTLNPPLARLQAPEASADKQLDRQESDTTSQEASIHTPSPRGNGSVTNFRSPVRRGNSIRTITQSASRADLSRGSGAGSGRSPAVAILPKHRLEHIPNRFHTLWYIDFIKRVFQTTCDLFLIDFQSF